MPPDPSLPGLIAATLIAGVLCVLLGRMLTARAARTPLSWVHEIVAGIAGSAVIIVVTGLAIGNRTYTLSVFQRDPLWKSFLIAIWYYHPAAMVILGSIMGVLLLCAFRLAVPERSRDITAVSFQSILKFFAHQLTSTFGIPFGCGPLLYEVWPAIRGINPAWRAITPGYLLTEIHLFPIQAVTGLLIGFVLYRKFRFGGMFWVWVIPWFILSLVFYYIPVSHVQFFAYFFGSACNPSERCFTQIVVTLPALSSAAYAVGAALAKVRLIQEN